MEEETGEGLLISYNMFKEIDIQLQEKSHFRVLEAYKRKIEEVVRARIKVREWMKYLKKE